MTITQEKLSFTGSPALEQLIDAQSFFPAYSKVKPSNQHQHVIWVTTPRGRYPIIFTSAELQMKAYDYMNSFTAADNIVLDLNEFFFKEILSEDECRERMKSIRLQSHMRNCLLKLSADTPLQTLQMREAFRHISLQDLERICRNEETELITVPKLWSKTLYVPKHILNAGITPLQFYTYI